MKATSTLDVYSSCVTSTEIFQGGEYIHFMWMRKRPYEVFQRGGLPLLSRGIDENIFLGVNILFSWCYMIFLFTWCPGKNIILHCFRGVLGTNFPGWGWGQIPFFFQEVIQTTLIHGGGGGGGGGSCFASLSVLGLVPHGMEEVIQTSLIHEGKGVKRRGGSWRRLLCFLTSTRFLMGWLIKY